MCGSLSQEAVTVDMRGPFPLVKVFGIHTAIH